MLFSSRLNMINLKNIVCEYKPIHNDFFKKDLLLESSILDNMLFSQRNLDVNGRSTGKYSLFKDLSYPYLLRKKFSKSSKDKARVFCDFILNSGRQVLVTPYNNLSSNYLLINDIDHFNKAWEKLIQKISMVTIESYQPGDPFKIFCKGREILAIYAITPAYVIGDGYSTLSNLIDDFNSQRNKNIFYKNYNLKNINKELDMAIVPIKGEIVQLKNNLQIPYGACHIDLTESTKNKYQELVNNIDDIASLKGYIEISCFSENIIAGVKDKTFTVSSIRKVLNIKSLLVNISSDFFNDIIFNNENKAWIPSYKKINKYDNKHFLSVYQIDVLREAAYQLGLKGTKLDPYLLLLEDTSSKKKVTFFAGMSQYTSDKARQLTLNKQITKEILDENNIRTPKGRLFNVKEKNAAIEYLNAHKNMKFVIKPLNLQGGKGVSTDIMTIEQLTAAWKRCEELQSQQIIIEEQIDGDDYRVLVINNHVCAVSRRVAPYVVGDGEKTISQLVELKNIKRKKNKYLAKNLIKINSYIEHYLSLQGYTINSIPDKGVRVALSKVSNAGSGGDIIDCSDLIHEDWIPIAVKIRRLMADAYHVGIDFLMEDISKSPQDQKWGVIEVNTNPDFAVHLFPSEGKPRNVGKFFLEEIFSPAPQEKSVYMLKILGKVQGVGYRKWFKLICEFRSVYGYIRNNSNSNIVEALIVGYKNNLDDIVEISYKGPKNARVKQIIIEELDNIEKYDALKNLDILHTV